MLLLCQWPRLFASLLVVILYGGECVCPTLGMFFSHLFSPPPQVSLRRVDHLILRGYGGCSGRNSVCMTNRAALLAHSIQCSPSTVMVMMSSMNPSIDASVAVMPTTRGSAFARWFSGSCLSSFGSEDMCGELRLSVYQDFSLSRSFPRSIEALLTVVYYSGAGFVPKGNHMQRKTGFSTIAMQVDLVVAFSCIRR